MHNHLVEPEVEGRKVTSHHNISIMNMFNIDNDGILDGIIALLQFLKKHIHLIMVIAQAPLPTTIFKLNYLTMLLLATFYNRILETLITCSYRFCKCLTLV